MRRPRGLSLAEVVFSGLLALLLCLAVMSAFPASVWAVSQSENLLQADQLAQSALDAAQARPFADLEPGEEELQPLTARGQSFMGKLEIFEVPPHRAELLKGLRVTVTWVERNRRRQVIHELWVSGLKS